VRLLVARCTVDYQGRLTAHLPEAVRLIMVKADGSVLVHADGGSYKPLNWMSPPCWLIEREHEGAGEGGGEPSVWVVENKAAERLTITLHEVLHDSEHELGTDPGLVKDGVEAHLQKLLAEHVESFGSGWTLVRREYPTAIGPVDCCAGTAMARRWRWRSSGVGRSTESSNSAATWSCSTEIPSWHRYRACSPRKRSSPRPGLWPRTGGSSAWSSITRS